MNNNEDIYQPGYTGWSLEKNDWDEVKDTMEKIDLDWNSLPLRSSFKDLLTDDGVGFANGSSRWCRKFKFTCSRALSAVYSYFESP